jgi:hypothetical protein
MWMEKGMLLRSKEEEEEGEYTMLKSSTLNKGGRGREYTFFQRDYS